MTCSERILALRRSPREMWLMLLFKLMTSFGYFALASVFVLLLSQEHGYSDRAAALLYGFWGFLTSASGVVTGPLIDRIGIRRSIVFGALLSCVGMFGVALSFDRTTLLLSALVVLPPGLSLGLPVIDIGGKRYSYAGNRTVVFALLYSFMNIGAAIAGVSFDGLRAALDAPHGGRLHVRGYSASAERLLVLGGACATCLAGLLAALTLRDVEMTREGDVRERHAPERLDDAGSLDTDALVEPEALAAAERGCCSRLGDCLWRAPLAKARWYYRSTIKRRVFWQLIVFTTSMLFVRQIFRQLDTTLPKWTLRVLGADAPVGSLYSVNPTLIVVLAPLAAAVFGRKDIYWVIVGGSAISALSIFILAGKASLFGVVLALVAFTVGEAIYSPQVTTFVLALAPEGREGTYTSLASAPLFTSKILVGFMSGELLQRHCPAPVAADDADAARSCAVVWVVIAGVALITPVLLVALRCFIYTDDVRFHISARTREIKLDGVTESGDFTLLGRSVRQTDDNDA